MLYKCKSNMFNRRGWKYKKLISSKIRRDAYRSCVLLSAVLLEWNPLLEQWLCLCLHIDRSLYKGNSSLEWGYLKVRNA